MGKITRLWTRLYCPYEAEGTGGPSERRQVDEASTKTNTQTAPQISLSDTEKLKVSQMLKRIDLTSVADQVVSELDSEYPPMDGSFNAVTAHRAAHLTLDKLVEKINGLTEGER